MITKNELEAIFEQQHNLKGIPGTKLENFANDFKTFIDKLNSHKDVLITHLDVGYPCQLENPGWKRYITKPLGFDLDLGIKSFYTQFSYISLRWVNVNHPRFNAKKYKKFKLQNCTTRLDVDNDSGIAKNILITSGFQLFDKNNRVLAQPEGFDLYYFNYSNFFAGQLAFNINREKKEMELFLGDDYFADVRPLEMDFSSYMYGLIEINDEIVDDAARD